MYVEVSIWQLGYYEILHDVVDVVTNSCLWQTFIECELRNHFNLACLSRVQDCARAYASERASRAKSSGFVNEWGVSARRFHPNGFRILHGSAINSNCFYIRSWSCKVLWTFQLLLHTVMVVQNFVDLPLSTTWRTFKQPEGRINFPQERYSFFRHDDTSLTEGTLVLNVSC